MSAVENLSADEQRAYDLITAEDGLLQSELWKTLDTTSRKGSRVARSLAKKGLVERKETVHDGRVTYLLIPSENGTEEISTTQDEQPEIRTEVEEKEDLSSREQRALSLIQEANALHQSDLWKELNVSSRTGSRIASNLAEKGLIKREEAIYDGRKTYLLTFTPSTEDLDFSLLMAGNMLSPLVGANNKVDPINSEAFTQWILMLVREEKQ